MQTNIIIPYHYKIYQREDLRWFTWEADRVFFNGTSKPLDLANVERQFNLTPKGVVVELFRINGGKTGYYLANLKDKAYYYCGTSWESVKETLLELGIGARG